MVLSQNGFGGMTGWQTKYFISSCPNRCVAQPRKARRRNNEHRPPGERLLSSPTYLFLEMFTQ